ncbi:ParM/StbA family protein [Paenibacillus sp. P22]|uniref:ParM/StbA family protein n=1 Tax=Paenibacillus sp. P22 TaxID=483908 RepID=UPI00038F855D|nr:ParM/StbA family protein [Paenibacillus sp. P22]CDN41706.1 Putative uncharacterized protein [Paenibacillus sp. P22]
MSIIGIDAGGSAVKLYDGRQFRQFPSAIGYDWRERHLQQQHGEHDYDWAYDGRRGFAGTLALHESQMADSLKGDSKAHPEARLRVLIALHQYAAGPEHDIVVGQPIGTHTKGQKELIKKLLIGEHEITINGRRKVITINRCEVAAEGVSAGLLAGTKGQVRVIDIGSGTVNYGTLLDGRYKDLESFTLVTGMETRRNPDLDSFARQIAAYAVNKGWGSQDTVYLCGGGADPLQRELVKYFGSAQLLKPGMSEYANVDAFYRIAKGLYANGQTD